MSQPEPPQPQPQPESTPDSPVALPKSAKSAKTFRARLPRVSRRRGTVLGVAVLLAVAAATGVAAVVHHHHHGEKGDHGQFAAEHRWSGGDGRQGAYGQARGGRGGRNDDSRLGGNSQNSQGTQSGQSTAGTLAPAPLPTVSAAAAIEAAGKAVSDGKTEALRVIAEQGGGSAWEVEVLGTDGVRHLVTIDGATGTVTSNIVAPTTSDTAS
ncbi:PepSY domain-containing protein [Streptomyces sp. NPDC004533]|uniref:PepSY domain-containing protein n=1 Tax=Streptomyces sp. NPDC004533 TaxID=3154278 RepID=UPI0033AA8FF2